LIFPLFFFFYRGPEVQYKLSTAIIREVSWVQISSMQSLRSGFPSPRDASTPQKTIMKGKCKMWPKTYKTDRIICTIKWGWGHKLWGDSHRILISISFINLLNNSRRKIIQSHNNVLWGW
jgi:hypothetical protein